MALARVQATPVTKAANTSSLMVTFTTPPAVGHAVIVLVNLWTSSAPTVSATDNRGHSYTLAVSRHRPNAFSAIFYTPVLTATGAPFTITVSRAAGLAYWVGVAIEVSGVGDGLMVDQTTSQDGTTSTISTGTTAAVTGSELFLAALQAIAAAQTSITVAAVSPAWTQEFEELPFTHIAGEGDSRIVTGAAGTTQTCSWTVSAAFNWSAVLVAFVAGETPPVYAAEVRASQLVVETAWQTPSAVSVSQLVIEVAWPVPPAAQVSTLNPGWLAWVEWPQVPEAVTRSGIVPPIVAYSDWDLQDPPGYYYGFKQARVERFGEATRNLSEPRTGDWQGSAFDFRLSDYDRLLRSRLASETERYWTVGNFILRMVTRQTRAALAEALTVFVGPLRRADPVPPLSMELQLEDVVGHTMLNDEHLIPQRVIDANDWEPGLVLADEAKGHPVPIIYGTHVRGNGGFQPVYLGVEGDNHVWLVAGHYARVLDVFLDGVGVTAGDPVDWTLPGWSGPLYETVAGKRYTLIRGRKGTPASVTDPVLYAENAGALEDYIESWIAGVISSDLFFPDPAARWDVTSTTSPRTGTHCIRGTGLLEGDTALGYFRLAGPPEPPAATAYFIADYTSLVLYLKNGTLGWGDAEVRLRFAISGEDLVMLGDWVTISDGLYGLDTFDDTTWQTITIPVEDFGIDETLPVNRLWIAKAGDDAIDLAIDDISFIGGDDVPAVITPADAAASGASRLTVNVSGWTTTGDDTGLVLAALADQYRHWLVNYVATPEGYQTGAGLDNPESDLFDRVVNVVHEGSFDVAKAQAIARYSPDGYLGHAIFGATPGDRLSVRQWIARWNLSADCRFGVTRYGELFIVMHDPTPDDQAEAPVVDEVLDVLEGSFSIDVQWTVQATRIPFRAGYNYATAEWTVFRDAEDTALSEAYGRPEGIPGAVREYWFVQDSDQAKNVCEHEVQRVGHPPKVVQFETHLDRLVTKELGEYLTVRHFAGVGPDDERLCQIEELTIAPGLRKMRIRALDVTALVPEATTLQRQRRRRHGR